MADTNRALRTLFERLPDGVRETIKHRRALLLGLGQLKRNQAMLARRVAQLEAAASAGRPLPSRIRDPRFPAGITSRLCTQAQLDEPWYTEWCAALGEEPRAHRKLWEHAYLAAALDALDQLRPGRTGLGFGVGREPLVALFAGRGCRVVATDLPRDAEGARGWSNVDQHSGGLQGLLRPDICAPDRFGELVRWRSVDMRAVPEDLTSFDFCWSACSLEHLGSLEAGLLFIERSLTTLAPGGVAIHTTEYNLSSNDATPRTGHTVLYRHRDLEGLVAGLEGAGHEVATLDLERGAGVLDEYVDLPPYGDDPHLALWYKTFTTTSVALVIRRRTAAG